MLTFLFYVCSSSIANYLRQTLNLTLFSSELGTVLLRWEIVLQQRIPGACTGKKYKFPSALNSYFFSSVALPFCHSLFIQRYKSRFQFHCNKELIWFARLQRPTEWLTEESGTGHFTVSNPRCRSLESAGKRMRFRCSRFGASESQNHSIAGIILIQRLRVCSNLLFFANNRKVNNGGKWIDRRLGDT